MRDQSVSPPGGGCVYSDANALLFYPGVGDQRRVYDSASASTSSPQKGREIKIRGSAISLEAAARSRRGLVVHTATMSDGEGERMRIRSCRSYRSSGVAEWIGGGHEVSW